MEVRGQKTDTSAQREQIHHTPDIFVLFSGVVDPTCIGGNHLNSAY